MRYVFVILLYVLIGCDDTECGTTGKTRCAENGTIERCSEDYYWETVVDCKKLIPVGGHCEMEGKYAKCFGI